MSAASERSFGEELVRIIRAEIKEYDRRKDEAVRLRKVANSVSRESGIPVSHTTIARWFENEAVVS